MVMKWFAWQQDKVWVRPDTVHTNLGKLGTLIWREGDNIINLPIPPWLRPPVAGLRLFWQLPWALFKHT